MRSLVVAILIAVFAFPQSPAHAGVLSVLKKAGDTTKAFVVRQVKALPDEISSGIVGAIVAVHVVPVVLPLLAKRPSAEKAFLKDPEVDHLIKKATDSGFQVVPNSYSEVIISGED